ncbi:MAG: hypothetical protein C0432_02040 [Candidatus Puniceispirillum sp.]|nr:hypothetical protein [Candidatus Pelagibacter sp.]MBA4283055.1 hypothetical protein [Candidatus Puniceispirillum sp.]
MLEKIIELSSININETDSNSKRYEKNAKIDAYYRNALTQIHNGKWISWNWSAFFLSVLWMLYRNMLLLPLMIIGIDIITECTFSEKLIESVAQFAWLYLIFFGLFNNKIYYHHLKRKVEKGYTRSMIQPTNHTFKKILFLFLSLLFTVNIVFLYLSKRKHQKKCRTR